jgi:hypothetical protein
MLLIYAIRLVRPPGPLWGMSQEPALPMSAEATPDSDATSPPVLLPTPQLKGAGGTRDRRLIVA